MSGTMKTIKFISQKYSHNYNLNCKSLQGNIVHRYLHCTQCFFPQGIGDNAQGLVNAILFCVFTKQVRKQLFSKEYYMSVCGGQKIQPTSAVDENTAFRNDRQFYNDTSVSYSHSVQNLHSVTQKIELSP